MDKQYITNTKLLDDQIGIFYLGQMGFLLKYAEKYILIDGYLSDYVDRKYGSGKVKWARRYDTPICPAELDFVDYVFCTHAHSDHADPDTLSGILRVNSKAKFVVSAAIASTIANYGIPADRIIGTVCDEKMQLEDQIWVTALPAAHEELHIDENGNYKEVGFRFQLGNTSLYHAGDCCPYNGLAQRVQGCDVMILPVNGRDYYRTQVNNIIGCFTAREAALLTKEAGASLLIPAHFDLYDVNCINPAEFVDTLKTVDPYQSFHIFAPGERYIFAK